MKKVGVITMGFTDNFGALLICYALHEKLLSFGFEPVFLTTQRTPPFWSGYGLRERSLSKLLSRAQGLFAGFKLRAKFTTARTKLNFQFVDLKSTSTSSFINQFSFLISGSDHVWHFSRDPFFFLNFPFSFCGKRIAYAGSFGGISQPHVSVDQLRLIKKSLLAHDSVSAREVFSQNLFCQLTGKSIPLVSDPTLFSDYPSLRASKDFPYEKPIVYYVLGRPLPPHEDVVLQRLRDLYPGSPLVWINANSQYLLHRPKAEFYEHDLTVGDWLHLMRSCSFLFTDSFHGMLFALRFGKPFLAFVEDEFRGSRLYDLQSRFASSALIATSTSEALHLLKEGRPPVPNVNSAFSQLTSFSNDWLAKSLGL
jgi:hypothetical protein